MAAKSSAKDFVNDAFAHQKFIAYTPEVSELLDATGLSSMMDDGFVDLSATDPAAFFEALAPLRYWERDVMP